MAPIDEVPEAERTNRIFALMDEGGDLEHRLARGFPELSFLYYADDMLRWLQRNRALVGAVLEVSPTDDDPSADLWTRRIDLLFHFGNFLASAQSGIDFLYNFGKGTDVFDANLSKALAARTDTLKKCAPQRVMTLLRNRMIHAPPLLDELVLQVRSKAHPEGEGRRLSPVLTDRAIAGLDKEIPPQGAAKDLWDAIKQDNASRVDWLFPLVKKHALEFDSAYSDGKKLVEFANQESLAEFRKIRLRRDVIEAELVALGTSKVL